MDRRLSFDGVAEIYDRIRPTYPEDHFDRLFAMLGENPRVVEVGPGTGQATGSLLSRGALVTAVEFGPRLADFLRAKFAGADGLSVVNATFEEAPLAPQSFDAVVAATSYHWVEEDARVSRPLELLRPGGWLALLNVIQVASDADHGYFERVQPIYDAFDQGNSESDKPSQWRPSTHEAVMPKIATQLRKSDRYQSVAVHRIAWDQTYTSAQYRDLLWSYSGTQCMVEPARTEMVNRLIAVIDEEHAGVLTRPLSATLALAQAPD